MPYLIDGHNLIGRLSGVSLSDPDDEAQLIQRLRAHLAGIGKKGEVVFDRGLPGGAHRWSTRLLAVRFAPSPKTADEVILERLRRLPDPQNWTVVTSDREVAEQARRRGARVLPSEAFARGMSRPASEPEAKQTGSSSEDDLSYWEDLFRKPRDD